jgi:hypothetical protein
MQKLTAEQIIGQNKVNSANISKTDAAHLSQPGQELTLEQMNDVAGGRRGYGDFYPESVNS